VRPRQFGSCYRKRSFRRRGALVPLDLSILSGLGLLTGFVLGALGSGGSILAFPAFVYAAGLPVNRGGDQPCRRRGVQPGGRGSGTDSLPKNKAVPVRKSMSVWRALCAGGISGSFVGTKLAHFLPDRAQLLLFACVMFRAALGMLRRAKRRLNRRLIH